MWKILLAELDYYKWVLMSVFGFLCVLGFSFILFHWETLTQFTMSTVIILFIATGILGGDSDSEKRDRMTKLLPSTLWRQSAARSLFLFLIVMSMYAMWIPFSLINPQGSFSHALSIMAHMSAVYLIVILSFCIFQDLGYIGKRIYRFIFLGFILAGFIIIILYIGTNAIHTESEFEFSPVMAIVLNLLAGAMLFGDIIIFIQRKTYLK